MKFSWSATIGVLLLAAVVFTGCINGAQDEEAEEELTVFVAASLTGALTDIAKQYEILHPNIRIITNFDGSQALRTQIEQGADADLFLSANTKQMNALRDQGLIENGSITLFAKNKLAVITPASNPGNITTLHDLARPGIRLVIGTKDVPVGDYARQILNKMANDPAYGPSYNTSVLANVMSEETAVTGVVAKVLLGEADAGIVYTSDITPENRDRFIVITIPDTFNVIAEYPAGIVAASQHKEEAAAFLAHLRGEQGRATLAKYGFALP